MDEASSFARMRGDEAVEVLPERDRLSDSSISREAHALWLAIRTTNLEARSTSETVDALRTTLT